MAAENLEFRPVRGKAKGDDYYRRQAQTLDASGEVAIYQGHKLDSEEVRRELRTLLQWFYFEREKQGVNRMDMAMDADFYDNLQWDPDDAQILRDRGQVPLVFNEVAPMVDWIIGTERRTRVDWSVMPRSPDDVESADLKTKVLKYTSDINRVVFNRSKAFSDAVKVGVGWLDDGVCDDPSKDIVYDKYEDWRNVLWDSSSYELDLSDARYIFRWRWVDEDVALMMFPERANEIRMAVEEATRNHDVTWEEETWITGTESLQARSGALYAMGSGMVADARRRRVKIYECQYRKPVATKIIMSGPLKGAVYHEADTALGDALGRVGGSIVDKVMMRVHVACFTQAHMLGMGPSIYRHNRFSLTPIWCYRRGRDRLPYGVVRRVRDIQQDLNKRASKALFLLNSNQVIADEDATDDWNTLRDEADRPDGLIIKKKGSEVTIRRDTDAATGQIQMMTMDAQSIQKSAGVTQENMGRPSNAVSGTAIHARQAQGGVVTTEPFDNLRLATQIQGEKQLSLVEQFYTEEKVIRLTGAKGAIDWVRVNTPEVQPDGSVRYLNDITASMADFIVSEQDYSGTLRQVMFDSLNQMAQRLPPEISMRILTVAMEFSDLPNKDEIAEQFRKITGEKDPNKKLTPEEQQAMQQQMQQQAEALQYQRQQAIVALQEQQAKVRELNARAAKLEAEAQASGQGMGADVEQAIAQARQESSDAIEALTQQLAKAQAELSNRTLQIRTDADTKLEIAHLQRDADVTIAAAKDASNERIAQIEAKLDHVLGLAQVDATKAQAEGKGEGAK